MKTAARLVAMVLAAGLLASTCGATVVTFGAYVAYSGTEPEGATPWVTVSFDDGGSSGSVTMTFAGANLTGTELVSVLYVNLDPNLNAANLTFSAPTKTGSFDTPAINLGTDAYQADGDGMFDIRLDFATSDGATTRFTSGDELEYTITLASLTAGSFNFNSAPDGGEGEYPMAAHVQSIGTGSDSGWVTTPEPGCLALLAAGALAVLRRRRAA